MAQAQNTDQLRQFVRTTKLQACAHLLASGRHMQETGEWVSNGGDDVFNAWQKTLRPGETLPPEFRFDIGYVDTAPPPATGRSAVLIHGTPGWYKNFAKLVPLLMAKKLRAVVPNMPGHGNSVPPELFRQSNDERAEFLEDFVRVVGIPQPDVMVGYSSGNYPLLKLAADPDFTVVDGSICRRFLWVSPGGMLKPHRSFQPYWCFRWAAEYQYGWVSEHFVGLLQKLYANFASPVAVDPAELKATTDLIANVGFSQLPTYLDRLRDPPIPENPPRVLVIYAEDDELVEKERNQETCQRLGITEPIVVGPGANMQQVLWQVQHWLEHGIGHAAVVFKKGGHDLLSTQPHFISDCVQLLATI